MKRDDGVTEPHGLNVASGMRARRAGMVVAGLSRSERSSWL